MQAKSANKALLLQIARADAPQTTYVTPPQNTNSVGRSHKEEKLKPCKPRRNVYPAFKHARKIENSKLVVIGDHRRPWVGLGLADQYTLVWTNAHFTRFPNYNSASQIEHLHRAAFFETKSPAISSQFCGSSWRRQNFACLPLYLLFARTPPT